MKEKILELMYNLEQGNINYKYASKQVLDLFSVVQQSEQLFCGECGDKRDFKVETDINSGRVCRNKLCKAK